MRSTTIPAAVVGAYIALDGALASSEALSRCGRVLGNRVECDLALVATEFGEEAASALAAYAAACNKLTASLAVGELLGEYAVTTRPLVSARQRDSREERRDLGCELEELCRISGLGSVIEAACGSTPEWETLLADGGAYNAAATHDGTDTTLTFVVEAEVTWPENLGGPAGPHEIARHVELRISHAAWRDRRNRRLVSVKISAEELWPVPQHTV